eukprot:COSAG02_NODE_30769_length_545_cov_1.621076_1_plen_26_part_01
MDRTDGTISCTARQLTGLCPEKPENT